MNAQREPEHKDIIPEHRDIYGRLVDCFDVLSSISNSNSWIHRFCNFEDAVESNRSAIRSKNPEEDWHFEINPAIQLPITSDRGFCAPEGRNVNPGDRLFDNGMTQDNSNARLVISGNVDVRDDQLRQYSMKLLVIHSAGSATERVLDDVCCEIHHADKHIVSRLLHFDLTMENDGPDPHPATHFQIGGNTDPNSIGMSSSVEHHYCRSRLDKPRFFHPPMDPVLLFDVAIRQYPELNRMSSDYWQSVVRESERIFWGDFYRTVADVFPQDDDEDFDPVSGRYIV